MTKRLNFTVGDILSHNEICSAEGKMLQHGMNFRTGRFDSIILMSRRKGAPYNDRILDEGRTLIYEGHDVPRTKGVTNPKAFDQPRFTKQGRLTPNGKFERAALEHKLGKSGPELVKVYEKIKEGIWTFNGVFQLVDCSVETEDSRKVFKFRLELTDHDFDETSRFLTELEHNRLIPSWVKQEVFKRDRGRCVLCGSPDNLHFDHDLPFSKGGASIVPDNIRLLCARHNLKKHDRIE
ncbi:MAG: HNH endonuclease signature motif containing protein [Candidatus Korobacteraceae bacterium]|jgi:hypothetical protein